MNKSPCSTRAAERRRCWEWLRPWLYWKGLFIALESWLNSYMKWSYEFIVHMNSYMNSYTWIHYEMIIWIHSLSLHEFIHEMIIWIHEYMDSCIYMNSCKWIHRYREILNLHMNSQGYEFIYKFRYMDFEFTYTNSYI